MSRQLMASGQWLTSHPSLLNMKYQEIREHVRSHYEAELARFKNRVATSGPLDADGLQQLDVQKGLAEDDFEFWPGATHEGGLIEATQALWDQRGINEQLSAADRKLLASEMQKAFVNYTAAAIEHSKGFDSYDLEPSKTSEPAPATSSKASEHQVPATKDSCNDVAKMHLDEGQRTNLWMAKTLTEKRDALALLGALVKNKPMSAIGKADARMVKSVLQQLPKNRNKSPATRGLTLDEMLQMDGLPVASIRTLNAYVSHFQTFFKWSVEQGFANENIFTGMRFRMPKRGKAVQRDAFTTKQLGVMFQHLTENPAGLVPKNEHKWVTLIAMFTGARLNEVSQLGVSDLLLQDDVWCFSFTTDGDDNKHLKTEASKRLVPVHDGLLACGLQSFMDAARAKGHTRLFPALSYDKQNGYGRNVGRWFNESFLVKLDMKTTTLSFHCLRHTMNTQLGQKSVPEHIQKAILGHTQSGMSYNTYFKEGFLPEQLLPEINKFSF